MATYHAAVGGTAATLGAADGTIVIGQAGWEAKYADIAVVNACVVSLLPTVYVTGGDTILFYDAGGAFGRLIPVKGGTDDTHRLTFAAAPGNTPVFAPGAGANCIQLATAGANNWITIDKFEVTPVGARLGIYISTSTTGLTLRNLVIDGAAQTDANAHGIYASTGQPDILLENLTIRATGAIASGYGILMQAAASSINLTMTGVSVTDCPSGVRIEQVANVAVSQFTSVGGVTVSSTAALALAGCTGTLAIGNCTITNPLRYGMSFESDGAVKCAFTAGSSNVRDVTVTGSGGGGFNTADASNIDLTRCISTDGTGTANGFRFYGASGGSQNIRCFFCQSHRMPGDGFDVAGNGNGTADIQLYFCSAISCGIKTDPATSAGDGFSAHNDSVRTVLDSCVAIGCTQSGVAMVGTSSGTIRNCLFRDNSGNWTGAGETASTRGNVNIETTGGAGWSVYNNTIKGGYPAAMVLSATQMALMAAGTVPFYNEYYPAVGLPFCKVGAGTYSWEQWRNVMGYEQRSVNLTVSGRGVAAGRTFAPSMSQ